MRRATEAGFTLVEMLIVLAIIGISAGAVALAVGRSAGEPSLEAEARRLAGRIQFAADEVMVDDRGLGFSWNARGYGFVARGESGWEPQASGALGYHALPGSMRLSGQGMVPIGADGSARPFMVQLSGRAGNWLVRFDGIRAAATPLPT